MSKPLISVFTPYFRGKRYLQTFLNGLPEQTVFEQAEFLLDLNEPDQEELAWVEQFVSEHPDRLRYNVIDKVDPVTVSMNRLIRQARADFVALWNVDDLRMPDSLAAQADALLQDSQVGVVYGNHITVDEFGKTSGDFYDVSRIDPSEVTRTLQLGPYYMFRRKVVDRSGLFDEQMTICCDHDFTLRLALHSKARFVDAVMGCGYNAGMGTSTRAENLKLLLAERALVHLRYGVWDALQWEDVPAALSFNVSQLQIDGQWRHVSEFVPNYAAFLEERGARWMAVGIRAQRRRQLGAPVLRFYRKVGDPIRAAVRRRVPFLWRILHRIKNEYTNRITYRTPRGI